MRIGFIGLGRMGSEMAGRLVSAGHDVAVYDTGGGGVATLEVQGARSLPGPKAVADGAEIVFLSLPAPDVVLAAALGDGGIAAGGAVRICVDLSTSGPQAARTLAAGLGKRDIALVEAPVSGGMKNAREGTLTLMVAGPAEAVATVRPLLEILGEPFLLGETAGAGQTMKLVDNLLGSCALAITAEGVALGTRAGLDPARMIDVLNASSGRSGATQEIWPRAILPRRFNFGFPLEQGLKDVRLCLAEAEAAGVPMAVGAVVRMLLERSFQRYGAHADISELAKLVETDAGLDPGRGG